LPGGIVKVIDLREGEISMVSPQASGRALRAPRRRRRHKTFLRQSLNSSKRDWRKKKPRKLLIYKGLLSPSERGCRGRTRTSTNIALIIKHFRHEFLYWLLYWLLFLRFCHFVISVMSSLSIDFAPNSSQIPLITSSSSIGVNWVLPHQ
jgi:hypothetical protein